MTNEKTLKPDKITHLTKEQEEQIPEYINKWVNCASTPMDKEKASYWTKELYKFMGKEEPIIIYGDSPGNTIKLAWLFLLLFNNKEEKTKQLDSQLYSQLSSQLGSQLGSQLYSQLDSQLGSQLDSQLGSQLYSQLDSQLSSQLDSQLGSQLYSQLDSQLGSQLYSQLDSQLYSQLDSQLGSQLYSQLSSLPDSLFKKELELVKNCFYVTIYWLVWSGWYEYGKYIGVKFMEETYNLFLGFCEQVHFIIPFEGICFISEKPKAIHWNNQKQLHKDLGLAVEYSDGWGLYALNGVQVPEYLVMTPSGKLDIEFWKKEKNADIRTEFRNKYGAERMKKLGKTVDSYKNYKNLNPEWRESKYELVDMAPVFNAIQYAPHLDMVNLTTGSRHLEPVSPKCKTIQDAIKFRWEEDTDSYETITIK